MCSSPAVPASLARTWSINSTDCTVRVLDDLSTGKEENLAGSLARPNFELIRGDVRDEELVAELLRDTDVVFHLACRGVRHSIGHPVESHEVNADGTLNMLVEARRAGVKRFVHVSSSEVYGTARFTPDGRKSSDISRNRLRGR